jgi:coenzyme F420 hydrogenase subunit beta
MPILATTEKEIKAATGSKYCPVAANLRLRDILDSEGKFAVVGLPCHIHGLRLAQTKIPKLRTKVVVCIALFCGLNMSPLGTRFVLRRKKVPIDQITELRSRGEGWPGYLTVQLQDSNEHREHLFSYFDKQFSAYQMYRCTQCSDAFGELADLSCGDAWLPEYRANDRQGTSVVIVRGTRGQDFVASAGQKALDLAPLEAEKAAQSQNQALLWKKDWLRAKAALARGTGKPVPAYKQDLPAASVKAYIGAGGQAVSRTLYRQWHQIRGLVR